MTQKKSSPAFLHTALIVLGFLLIILLAAMFSRMLFPRITSERNDPEAFLSSIIQVEVLNGCGVPGLATRYTSFLRHNGFDVVSSGNFETFDIEESLVIDRRGNMENARRVARVLGIPENRILREISSDFYLDATIVIGADYEFLNH